MKKAFVIAKTSNGIRKLSVDNILSFNKFELMVSQARNTLSRTAQLVLSNS